MLSWEVGEKSEGVNCIYKYCERIMARALNVHEAHEARAFKADTERNGVQVLS